MANGQNNNQGRPINDIMPTGEGTNVADAGTPKEQSGDNIVSSIKDRKAKLDKDVGQAREEVKTSTAEAQALPSTESSINVLQEALRKKQGTKDMDIGKSKIFEKAGVSGFGALAESLNARSKEVKQNFSRFNNFVSGMFTKLNDFNEDVRQDAKLALDRYKVIKDERDNLVDKLYKLEKDAMGHERQLKLLEKKSELNKEEIRFKEKFDSGGGGGQTGDLGSKLFAQKDMPEKGIEKGDLIGFQGEEGGSPVYKDPEGNRINAGDLPTLNFDTQPVSEEKSDLEKLGISSDVQEQVKSSISGKTSRSGEGSVDNETDKQRKSFGDKVFDFLSG